MLVYRLCKKDEITSILDDGTFANAGGICENDSKRNTHNYEPGKRYVHFFSSITDLLFLFLERNRYICVYDIPEDILEKGKGTGYYLDYVFFEKLCSCEEYAIPVDEMQVPFLKEVRVITETVDYDEIMTSLPLDDFSKTIYEKGESKRLLNNQNTTK